MNRGQTVISANHSRLSVLLAKIDNLLKKSNRMGIDFRKQISVRS